MVAGAHLAAQQIDGTAALLTAWDNTRTFTHLERVLLRHGSLLVETVGVRVGRYHWVLECVHEGLLDRHVGVVVLITTSPRILYNRLLLGRNSHAEVKLGSQLRLCLFTASKLVGHFLLTLDRDDAHVRELVLGELAFPDEFEARARALRA